MSRLWKTHQKGQVIQEGCQGCQTISCPAYEKQLRSLTYSSPPPPPDWTIRQLRMVVYPRELASASSQDPIVSDEGEGDNVGQKIKAQSAPPLMSHLWWTKQMREQDPPTGSQQQQKQQQQHQHQVQQQLQQQQHQQQQNNSSNNNSSNNTAATTTAATTSAATTTAAIDKWTSSERVPNWPGTIPTEIFAGGAMPTHVINVVCLLCQWSRPFMISTSNCSSNLAGGVRRRANQCQQRCVHSSCALPCSLTSDIFN